MGLENFEQIINDNYYYVDKTGLISELLRNGGMVNLFTRPRRFGKTLNMSMIEHFFSIERDQSIFDGLEISKDTKLCEEYMGKYPVISISLKGINAATYKDAFDFAVQIMKEVAATMQFLLESKQLSEYDKSEYQKLLDDNMSEAVFCSSLKKLSILLEKHYGTKVVFLIDEYDVPLAKAFENGYQFGSVEVYCPWDVLNYCDKLKDHADSFPENYWINTSGNDAVKKFIQMSGNFKTKREIETLLAGEEIIKEIHQELVYPEMYQSLENVWSLLFMTGYLTQRGRVDAQACERALQQIEEKKYDEELRENGVNKILKYGIACYMKRCKVKQAEKLS
ncbi:ATP-binding protein [Mediterraneibacter sp. NSJ-151]|uniref:AAA family ATPase n=1 Tax=Mediterraneibacter sp. NSJ-151 TaxID=2897708 RepID=UPI001F0A3611|nr:ATP-binding protein [Mediterraneibacter sp. NSJ-151]